MFIQDFCSPRTHSPSSLAHNRCRESAGLKTLQVSLGMKTSSSDKGAGCTETLDKLSRVLLGGRGEPLSLDGFSYVGLLVLRWHPGFEKLEVEIFVLKKKKRDPIFKCWHSIHKLKTLYKANNTPARFSPESLMIYTNC